MHKSGCESPFQKDQGPENTAGIDERNKVPIRSASGARTMLPMSMYVDILSSALDDWVDDLSGPALVEYALGRRIEMLEAGPPHGETAYASLAYEIAYDRCLIKLCEKHAIDVTPTNFTIPKLERSRLEGELTKVGIDLAELARRRREA